MVPLTLTTPCSINTSASRREHIPLLAINLFKRIPLSAKTEGFLVLAVLAVVPSNSRDFFNGLLLNPPLFSLGAANSAPKLNSSDLSFEDLNFEYDLLASGLVLNPRSLLLNFFFEKVPSSLPNSVLGEFNFLPLATFLRFSVNVEPFLGPPLPKLGLSEALFPRFPFAPLESPDFGELLFFLISFIKRGAKIVIFYS